MKVQAKLLYEIKMMISALSFRTSHKKAITLMVQGNATFPVYKSGDIVGGLLQPVSVVKDGDNREYIVVLRDGSQFFRKIHKTHNGQYNLVQSQNESTIYNVDIKAVATITFHEKF